jgi:hypothetical protein
MIPWHKLILTPIVDKGHEVSDTDADNPTAHSNISLPRLRLGWHVSQNHTDDVKQELSLNGIITGEIGATEDLARGGPFLLFGFEESFAVCMAVVAFDPILHHGTGS